MNKDNAKDFLPLVQALADGKTIQYRAGGTSNPWMDMNLALNGIAFSSPRECYRIKPEPRTFYLAVPLPESGLSRELSVQVVTETVYKQKNNETYYEYIKVQEVIE